MREKELEKKFVAAVKSHGGRAYKFVSPGNSGVPDRIVILPEGKIGFVELKAPGKTSRPDQRNQQRILETLGCYVAVVDRQEMIEQVIQEIMEYTADDILLYILEAGGLI